MKYESTYKQIVDADHPTVIEEFKKDYSNRSTKYQTEKELEDNFISILTSQGYEYFDLVKTNQKHEDALTNNLRDKIEKLNNYHFLDEEWDDIFKNWIANENYDQVKKSEIIQTDCIYSLKLKDGSIKNIKLIDKDNIYNNSLQVINQYVNNDGKYDNRYDVSILVNGLPLIHIELKRRGIELKAAFNQIERYKNDSFSASNGLFEYVQIFVISNGTETKYYSNTTRQSQINPNPQIKTSKSYEFTMYWSDAQNNKINDLEDFAKTFFAKHSILNILTKYCVFNTNKNLLVMRPYQIVACERILNKVYYSINNPNILGSPNAGGYVWHTTGSGKTLTSFKASQLIIKFPEIKKVIFVVDRKDLDYQTINEYNKFQKDCVKLNKSSKELEKRLDSDNEKMAVTTIQKLSNFIKVNKSHKIFKEHVVLIFDECHRSQFGEMHKEINKAFKKSNIFGFTGTPIFKENTHLATPVEILKAQEKSKNSFITIKTTEQLFGERLHTYSIVNGIKDNNVLKFHLEQYVCEKEVKKTVDDNEEIEASLDLDSYFENPQRISIIVEFIIRKFNLICKGFNSILAVSSINAAKKYYDEFRKQIDEKNIDLKVATIFSYNPNEDLEDENNESADGLDKSSREFLDRAMNDYNQMFKDNESQFSSKDFNLYYQDVAKKMRDKKIDILIVVNMFLTGFDAPTLNTLWVDKKLQMHGLIQAMSRTNRIYDKSKPAGNIISFIPIKKRIDEALKIFGENGGTSCILLREFNDYYNGYKDDDGEFYQGYKQFWNCLTKSFPIEKMDTLFTDQKKDFIKKFNDYLQCSNLLMSYDEFTDDKKLMSDRDFQDYKSYYLSYKEEFKKQQKNKAKEDIADDIVFEIELIKQTDFDDSYIDKLLDKPIKFVNDENYISSLMSIISSSSQLRNKKELIEKFIQYMRDEFEEDENSFKEQLNILDVFIEFKKQMSHEKLQKIIQEYNLKQQETQNLIDRCREQGFFEAKGTTIRDLMKNKPSYFFKNENSVDIDKIYDELNKYFDSFYK